jgi:hypothetical protein
MHELSFSVYVYGLAYKGIYLCLAGTQTLAINFRRIKTHLLLVDPTVRNSVV